MAVEIYAGCWGDGRYGHQYTRERCAYAIRCVMASVPSATWADHAVKVAPLLRALDADMSDDANEETEACDWLNDIAGRNGHWWGWQDGDFGLWPEDDRETLP